MRYNPVHKKSPGHTPFLLMLLFVFLFLLTGCADMTEVQDRDFVLALGASLNNDQF